MVFYDKYIFFKILGTWYQADWWYGTHEEEDHVKDNVAITIRRKAGKDGELIFTHHSRYVRL